MHLSTLLTLTVATATTVLATPLQLHQRQGINVTTTPSNSTASVQYCGSKPYYPYAYNCYNGTALCPIIAGVPTLNCAGACYDPSVYGCSSGNLVQLNPNTFVNGSSVGTAAVPGAMYPATITLPKGTPMPTPPGQ
ncbi:carbohydrate-binding module family 52 protein [Saccharata proteae CBS 121410]|uniref:Carbohydrate-binding module family 52 protein n=1 Tax=Saccharata proteae CBS 121410 TaxID=1314787 RepID=A0A9P4HP43_9PEZI|nr:carbohydrate-binding module family 52 protein [Saccharata proteae CBS 121410]